MTSTETKTDRRYTNAGGKPVAVCYLCMWRAAAPTREE
jgi:hypothetical protein